MIRWTVPKCIAKFLLSFPILTFPIIDILKHLVLLTILAKLLNYTRTAKTMPLFSFIFAHLACLLAFDGTDLILHYTKIERIYVSHIEYPTWRTNVFLADSRPRPHDERRQRGRRVDRLGRGHEHSGPLPKTPLVPFAGCSRLATRLASNQDCLHLQHLQCERYDRIFVGFIIINIET